MLGNHEFLVNLLAMTSFRIRPRFKVISKKTPLEIERDLQECLKTSKTCIGTIIHHHIVLKIPPEDQHYWSPQLSLNLEEENGETVIHGFYGPNPTVWTLFIFSYATLGILSLFIGIMGLSKYSLGQPSLELWILPLLGIIAFVLYMMSQIGQKIGAEQTFAIHHFFEEALNTKVHIV